MPPTTPRNRAPPKKVPGAPHKKNDPTNANNRTNASHVASRCLMSEFDQAQNGTHPMTPFM